MKKKTGLLIAIATLILAGFVSCKNNSGSESPTHSFAQKIYKIKGSETVRPVIEKLLERFSENNTNVFISYEGGGSNFGINSIINDEADIVFSSRPITMEEEKKLSGKYSISEFGFDGILVVVNSSNPIKQLTIEQIRNIYSGKIKNWKELGGNDVPVVLFSRDVNSGTYSFFKEHVMFETPFSHDDINLAHNKEIINNIIQSPGAIGYVGHADLQQGATAVKLKGDQESDFVEPNFANIKYLTYPLARKITLIADKNPDASLKAFLDFISTPESKQITTDAGLLPSGE